MMKQALQQIHRTGMAGIQQFTNLVLPPRCYGCGAGVVDTHMLCPDCYQALSPITPPFCDQCALPLDAENNGDGLARICARCSSRKSPLDHLRAAWIYDDGTRPLILAFKHGDRTDMAPALASWLARASRDLCGDDGLIVPVPLWRGRLFRRRYNQAAELARHLARETPSGWHPDLLKRHRNTGHQGGLSYSARHRNLTNAFSITPGCDPALLARPILLVDDVYTTGATLEACAATLKKAGATSVSGIVLARVDRPGRVD